MWEKRYVPKEAIQPELAAWEKFEQTGTVAAYLQYRHCNEGVNLADTDVVVSPKNEIPLVD